MKERTRKLLEQAAKSERITADDMFAIVSRKLEDVIKKTVECNGRYAVCSHDHWDRTSLCLGEYSSRKEAVKVFEEHDGKLSAEEREQCGYSCWTPGGYRIR